VRPLNPTNSFLFVGAFVGSWNMSETFTGPDYRCYGHQLIGDLRYVLLTGGFFGTGFFRDRDQVTARMTYLMN
jgi:hypothetical protein